MVGDDIYSRDLTSMSSYTPVATPTPQVPNIYASKVNMDQDSILKINPIKVVPAQLAFGGSASQAPYKSVSMMSQVMHESH